MNVTPWVDRAARALCKSQGRHWGNLRRTQREAFYKHAGAMIEALRYADGQDEEAAVMAGREIGVDAVLAIGCLEGWIDAAFGLYSTPARR